MSAATLDDPALVRYARSCPDLKLNKTVIKDEYLDSSEEEQDAAGAAYYSSANFRLYFTNMDDSPDGENKYILYAGDHNCLRNDKDNCTNPQYVSVNFERCVTSSINISTNPYDETELEKHGYSEIIIYQGRHYFLSAGDGHSSQSDIQNLMLFTDSRQPDGFLDLEGPYQAKHSHFCGYVPINSNR